METRKAALNSCGPGRARHEPRTLPQHRRSETITYVGAMTVHLTPASVARCFIAWCRVLDAVADQREALDHRIWREDPNDTYLEADVRTWCELSRALAYFLKARRAA